MRNNARQMMAIIKNLRFAAVIRNYVAICGLYLLSSVAAGYLTLIGIGIHTQRIC